MGLNLEFLTVVWNIVVSTKLAQNWAFWEICVIMSCIWDQFQYKINSHIFILMVFECNYIWRRERHISSVFWDVGRTALFTFKHFILQVIKEMTAMLQPVIIVVNLPSNIYLVHLSQHEFHFWLRYWHFDCKITICILCFFNAFDHTVKVLMLLIIPLEHIRQSYTYVFLFKNIQVLSLIFDVW